MRPLLAATMVAFSMRGPHGCVSPPTFEQLVSERITQAGLDSVAHLGHTTLEDPQDCVTPAERLRSQAFQAHARACTPARFDLWEKKGGGMAHAAIVVLPHNGGCAVEAFSDNTRVPGKKPTSIRYQVDEIRFRSCRGLGVVATERWWWRLAPDDTPVPASR